VRRVLVVDPDGTRREAVRAYLTARAHQVRDTGSLEDAATEVLAASFDVIVLDAQLSLAQPDDPVAKLARLDGGAQRVMTGAPGGLEQAARQGRRRADHVLARPLDLAALEMTVAHLLQVQQTRRRTLAVDVIAQRRGRDPFAGSSRIIQELADQAHSVLDSHAPILIQGETGTGKGVLASWFHQHGPRAEEAFVDINCAGLSKDLLESELFGHERGAFTGATAPKLGLLDVAHKGSAFLDEIGEIDLLMQPRLLKVLEEKRFRRLGDVRDHVVDIRLIAATNRDLARRSREGLFRADLYYRINTISLVLPSLRQRREDIPQLARQVAHELGHDIDFTPDAIAAMQAYSWPGNVRELRNIIERALLTSRTSAWLTPRDLRFEIGAPEVACAEEGEEADLGTLEQAERRHIERVLRHEQGSVEKAATRLGVSRSTLYQKLKRHGLGTSRG